NTAVGAYALYYNNGDGYPLGGAENSALGAYALSNNVDGNGNVAFGSYALYNNAGFIEFDVGNRNTAVGTYALYDNQGSDNTAVGYSVLNANINGTENTAVGAQALPDNTEGSYNAATGYQALYSNTTGDTNTAAGYKALYSNSTGFSNAAVGALALYNNSTGSGNVALGVSAGFNATTGGGNVYIGDGVEGVAGESNTTRIKNIGATLQDTQIYVTLDTVGGNKLGYVNLSSSRRFKEDIKPMATSSEAIFALHPVKFRYKAEINPDRTERFGLIAEEVKEINPDLVSHDSEGKPLAVRYESVNAMLLNEFLKEHKKVEEQHSTIENQQATIVELKSMV